MTTPAEHFQARIVQANPPDAVVDRAIAGHTLIRQALDQLPGAPRTFLTGSYGRRTHNHPLNDVDIFLVLENASEADASRVLGVVARHLHQRLPPGSRLRPQEKSIGIALPDSDMSFDVIPALAMAPLPANLDEYDGGFRIPVRAGNMYIATFPLQAKSALREANTRCDRLIPLIKLLKQMNAAWARPVMDEAGRQVLDDDGNPKTKKPLKSFHLEVMCYSAEIAQHANDRARFRALLLHLVGKVRDRTLHPPGGGTPLGAYFDEPRPWPLVDVIEWLQNLAQAAYNAEQLEAQGRHTQAIQQWQQLLNGAGQQH